MADEKTFNPDEYFKNIDNKLKECYKVAQEARKKGLDPMDSVEIPIASNMAERVEGLISAVYPKIIGTGISKRLTQLEKKYGALDWKISLVIAEEISREKFCKFKDKLEAMEAGIRVGLAYHTMGSVSSPIEGFTRLQVKKRYDGKEYLAIYFSGPIRSAGGTGASVSVLIADYIRKKFGYESYDPTENEINRIATELHDYHERVTNLQYLPSQEEIKFLVKHLALQIDGDPSEKFEVSNYKDLKRIETNTIRNGVCLVIGEGIAQKAPKLWKQLEKWGKEFDLENWNFLEEFIKLQKRIKSGKETKGEESKSKVSPDYTFIKDLVAGRPILTHPMKIGGFRLRYGRTRTSGYSCYAIHPATMHSLKKYIAIGTQLKVERPGKGCTVTSSDSIEGPIVLMENGSVVKLDTEEDAKKHMDKIKKILYLGDMLINYGDFFNRAHVLIPPGYCEEWWVQELEKGIVNLFGTLDFDKTSEITEIPSNALESLVKNPFKTKISSEAAIVLSKKLDIPLHPFYTYHWKSISIEEFNTILKWLLKISIQKENNKVIKIIFPYDKDLKKALEKIGIPHILVNQEFVVIDKENSKSFLIQLGADDRIEADKLMKIATENHFSDTLEIVKIMSNVKLRDKSGYFIGARMGRPEKAKVRQLTGSPHVLFPVGEEGGRLRSFQSALEVGKITSDFPIYKCAKCERNTIYPKCNICSRKTKKMHYCNICGDIEKEECPKHGITTDFKTQDLDINHYFGNMLKDLKIADYPNLIKGVRGTSNKSHTPEQLAKGLLRASHDVYVNKDGTTRYDMTQLPITHFKPKEIKASVEKLNELGYKCDIYGKPLINTDQILELKVQDVILPSNDGSQDPGANKILFNVTKFLDDLLIKFYGLGPFYNLSSETDLIGHLGLVLAPHTSAGIIVRIIGFSKTQGLFAHPMLHAATRRDCDGDEASISLLLDMLINFSRHYLPAHRGSTQDTCLVATSKLIPGEVDDMVFDMDIAWKYPLEFYNACLDFKMPWEVEIKKVSNVLNTPNEYFGIGFTTPTDDLNQGVRCSAYKTIPLMEDKLKGQMELAEKIVAVDENDVARMVIEKHFLKDIKGNLRKFSMQQFRCVKCNEKFRRPPLVGKCTKCGGKIIFTISEGSIIKYLEPSISLAEKYDAPIYLKQTLDLLRRRVDGVFGKDKEKQEGLGRWFG
ncbi:MAG: DNA polymerase II large subunit [Candidatus Woesearchaeota archaeon]